jgi:hypothetical protein
MKLHQEQAIVGCPAGWRQLKLTKLGWHTWVNPDQFLPHDPTPTFTYLYEYDDRQVEFVNVELVKTSVRLETRLVFALAMYDGK